ncbi:MAG TPA: YfhO family protein, partial [Isosphaeraceae bacterium]|nr:YfhO family protein [Isosphaeraceae bacterium]
HRNRGGLPRVRLAGSPVYASDEPQAVAQLDRLGPDLRNYLVVEDPTHPLPTASAVLGTAQIVEEIPDRVVVEADAATPAYLVLSDTFDPGWSATVDGQPAPIRPAYVAFRAVYLSEGKHTIVFTYRPAGFVLGLGLSGCGILLGLFLWFLPARPVVLAPDHARLNWPPRWRTWWFVVLGVIVLLSVVGIGPGGRPVLQSRWAGSVHHFTWGSGIEAIPANRH